MAEEGTVGRSTYVIDASDAKKGAAEIVKAFKSIEDAAKRASSSQVLSNFQRLLDMMTKLSSLQGINQNVINGLTQLSQALSTFKAPSAVAIRNVEQLFAVIKAAGSGGTAMVNRVTALSAAFAAMKVPTEGQILRLEQFFVTMSGAKIGGGNVGSIVKNLDAITVAANNAAHSVGLLVNNLASLRTGPMRGIAGQANQATANLSGFNNQLSLTNRLASNTIGTLQSLGAAFALGAIIHAGANLESIRASFDAVFGSVDKGNEAFKEVEKIANQAGVSIAAISSEYSKFAVAAKSAGFSGEETNKMFEEIVKSGRILGLSSEDVAGQLKALQQMMSKGKIQAEELRGQLGDRLPAAFQIMAKSVGVSTAQLDKLMKQGKLTTDILPKFVDNIYATVGGNEAFARSTDTVMASLGRLQNVFLEFSDALLQAGLGEAINKVATSLEEAFAKGEFDNAIHILGEAFKILGDILVVVVDHFQLLLGIMVAKKIYDFVGALSSFTIVAATSSSAAVTLGTALTTAGGGAQIAAAGLRALGVVMEFLSGPVGWITLAAGALTVFATTTNTATKQLDSYHKEVEAALPSVKALAESMKSVAIETAKVDLSKATDDMNAAGRALNTWLGVFEPDKVSKMHFESLGVPDVVIHSYQDALDWTNKYKAALVDHPELVEDSQVQKLVMLVKNFMEMSLRAQDASDALKKLQAENDNTAKTVDNMTGSYHKLFEAMDQDPKGLEAARKKAMDAATQLYILKTQGKDAYDAQKRLNEAQNEAANIAKGNSRVYDEALVVTTQTVETQHQIDEILNKYKKDTKETETEERKRIKAIQEMNLSMDDYIAKADAQRSGLGKTAGQLAALTEQERLLNYQKEHHIKLDDAQQEIQDEYLKNVQQTVDWNDELTNIYKEQDAARQKLMDYTQHLNDEITAIQMVNAGEATTVEQAQTLLDIRRQLETLGYSDADIKKAQGNYKDLDATAKHLNDTLERQKQLASEVGDAFSTAFEDAILKGGKLMDVLSKLFEQLAESAWKQGVFPIISNYLGSTLTSMLHFAKGGVIDSPTLLTSSGAGKGSPYGMAGEAGTEAIIPLTRGPGGQLGVSSWGAGGGGGDIVIAPTMNISVQGSGDETKDTKLANNIGKSVNENLRSLVRDELQRQARPGGFFKPAYGVS